MFYNVLAVPRTLDPRFALEVAAMKSAGWIAREVGRERAERFARASGYTYAEALQEIGKGPAPLPLVISPPAESPPETAHFRSSNPEPERAANLSTDRPRFASLPADVAGAISAALAADPSRTDRDIARELRCSPTTVGRARAAAGLVRDVREVKRNGRTYPMRLSTT